VRHRLVPGPARQPDLPRVPLHRRAHPGPPARGHRRGLDHHRGLDPHRHPGRGGSAVGRATDRGPVRVMSRAAAVALAACVVAVASCGAASTTPAPPTLAAGAVALPSSLKPLTSHGLAREAQAPGLAAQLGSWGFLTGADRYFQVESRQLQVVDSRTLRFRSAQGASAFVGFMRLHTYAFLGSFAQVRGLSSRGRQGILAVGQPCQCHLANPAYLAVVSRGATVSWLLINGPGATPRRLAALLAQAP